MYIWMRVGKSEEEASATVYEELYREFVLRRSSIPTHAKIMAQ